MAERRGPIERTGVGVHSLAWKRNRSRSDCSKAVVAATSTRHDEAEATPIEAIVTAASADRGVSCESSGERKLTLRCQKFLHGGATRLYFARSSDGTERRDGLPSAAFFLRRTSSEDEV